MFFGRQHTAVDNKTTESHQLSPCLGSCSLSRCFLASCWLRLPGTVAHSQNADPARRVGRPSHLELRCHVFPTLFRPIVHRAIHIGSSIRIGRGSGDEPQGREGKGMKHAPGATQMQRRPPFLALVDVFVAARNVNLDSPQSESDGGGFQVDVCWAAQGITSGRHWVPPAPDPACAWGEAWGNVSCGGMHSARQLPLFSLYESSMGECV